MASSLNPKQFKQMLKQQTKESFLGESAHGWEGNWEISEKQHHGIKPKPVGEFTLPS
jgi:hypothetical protein